MDKVATISGFNGQCGSLLAQHLLAQGYKVYGLVRRSSHPNDDFIEEMGLEDVITCEWDLLDTNSIHEVIAGIKPDEFYNLGAMSHVGTSFHQPEYTAEATGLGVLRVLEEIRKYSPTTKLYQASSSEMMGDNPNIPHNESSVFMPRSPYAAAKVFAHNLVKVYRESYNLFACCGILYNNESERRSLKFLTRKVTDYVGKRVNGLIDVPLQVGYLYAKRDWGYSRDYVKAMQLMLQHDKPDDYCIASGESYTVKEFITKAFKYAGFNLEWFDEGINEYAVDTITGKTMITIDPTLYRPAEVPHLLGDYSKAKRVLGWEPSTSFDELVAIMVNYDIKRYHNKARKYVYTPN